MVSRPDRASKHLSLSSMYPRCLSFEIQSVAQPAITPIQPHYLKQDLQAQSPTLKGYDPPEKAGLQSELGAFGLWVPEAICDTLGRTTIGLKLLISIPNKKYANGCLKLRSLQLGCPNANSCETSIVV